MLVMTEVHLLGTTLDMHHDTQTVERLKSSAEAGDSEAQCMLANLYHFGLGVEQDILRAMEWYEKSARQGYAVASNNLAGIFNSGTDGMPPDQLAAMYWYQQARDQGFAHTPINVSYLDEALIAEPDH